MRASSWSARAGMIASSSGSVAVDRRLLDREPVRVGGGHHDLARLEPDEDPGEDRAALVTRRAAADPRDRLDERVAVDRVQRQRLDVGQPRKVFRRVRVQAVRRGPDVTTTTASSGRCSIDTSLSGSERAMSSSRRPGTTTVPSPATCASTDARSETSMSVAARCNRPASARSWIPPSTSTAVRVETPRATVASFAASSSFATVILSPAPTIVSESIIYKNLAVVIRPVGPGKPVPTR